MKRFLSILIAMLFALQLSAQPYTFSRVYPFSKSVTRVAVQWTLNTDPDASAYWLYVHSYTGSIPWASFSTSHPNSAYEFNFSQLGDSALVFIVCEDSSGNKGVGSDTVKIAFRADGVTPPPVIPPADTTSKTDLPLVDTSFRSKDKGGPWTFSGASAWDTRVYEFGYGLYFFEYLMPGEQYNCFLYRTILLPAGKISVTLKCASSRAADSLDVSIGSLKRRLKIPTVKPYSTSMADVSTTFSIPTTGSYILKIDPRANMGLSSLNINQGSGTADLIPPGKVNLTNVLKAGE